MLAPLAGAVAHATPSAGAVAQLALEGARVDVLVGGAPTYIRASEAEVSYPDGVPGALRKALTRVSSMALPTPGGCV